MYALLNTDCIYAFFISYSKKEHLRPGEWEMYQYTHLIAEAKSKFSPNLKPYVATHDVIDTIEAFHQLSFNYLTIPPVKIKTKPVLFILKRRENYKELLQISQESSENVDENRLSDEDYLKMVERMESQTFVKDSAASEDESSFEDNKRRDESEEEIEETSEQDSEENPNETSVPEDDTLTDENIEVSTESKTEESEEFHTPSVDNSKTLDKPEGKVKFIKRQKTETKIEEKILPKLLKKSKQSEEEDVTRDIKTDRHLEDGLKSKKFKVKEEISVPKPPKKFSLVDDSEEIVTEKSIKKSKVEVHAKSLNDIQTDKEDSTNTRERIPKYSVREDNDDDDDESEEVVEIISKKSKLEVKSEEKAVPKPLKKAELVEELEEANMEKPVKKIKFVNEKIAPKLFKNIEVEDYGGSIEEPIIQKRPTEIKYEDVPKRPKLEVKSEEKHTPKLLKKKGEESPKEYDKPILKPITKQYKQVTSLALPKKGAESRQNVRQNIRKIIQTFKRKHIDEEFPPQLKENLHAKETIKKIIEEERSKQEKDEINKIQLQIMEIIESNPNIINKELIKSRLQETIVSELVNAIDYNIHDTEGKIKKTEEDVKKPKDFSRRFPEAVKKSFEAEPSPLKNLKDELSKETPVSKISVEEYDKSDENYEPGEVDVAINLYGSHRTSSDIQSDEDAPKPTKLDEHILEEEKIAFIKRFKKANEKLDNILTIIDEIVDTIEITDEDDEDTFR